MHEDIKKYADIGDTRELKYRFNNSLDIDPTFEKYKEDFEYCKKQKAFESHKKLTPLEFNNPSKWNDIYWANLKKDLFDNFSQKRLEHMIKVAKVIYKDKIERLIEERQQPKEEPKYTKITSEPTEEEKAIEKQENEKKRIEQIEKFKKQLNEDNKTKLENSSNPKKIEITIEKDEINTNPTLLQNNNEGIIADQRNNHTNNNKQTENSIEKLYKDQIAKAQKQLNEDNKTIIIENEVKLKNASERQKDLDTNKDLLYYSVVEDYIPHLNKI